MPRLVKCYGTCGEKYDKEEMLQISNTNYCPDCYHSKMKETHDRELLYSTIKTTFNLNFPTGLMLRQIKQYREERKYTYKNISLTIKYITEVKKMNLMMGSGIALVPHFYDEMIKYYRDLNERRANTVVKEQETKKITISPFVFKNEYKSKKVIDMNSLIKEDI